MPSATAPPIPAWFSKPSRAEANLAAQKQAPALSLIAALGAIRSAVRQAKASAIEAMPRVDTDEVLTGARNGTRIIREIA